MLSAARVMVDGLCGEPHFVSAPLCQFLQWFIVYFPLNRNKMVDEMGVTYVCKCKKKKVFILQAFTLETFDHGLSVSISYLQSLRRSHTAASVVMCPGMHGSVADIFCP